MSRLSSAGFRRLFSMKLFWTLLIGTNLIYGVFTSSEPRVLNLSKALIGALLPAYLASVIVAAFYINLEYQSGVLRNKLISGQSRRELYNSWITVLFCMSMIIYSSLLISTYFIGMMKEHCFSTGIEQFVESVVLSILVLLGNATVCVFLMNRAGRGNKVFLWTIGHFFLAIIILYVLLEGYAVINRGTLSFYDECFRIVVMICMYITPVGGLYRLTLGDLLGHTRMEELKDMFQPESSNSFLLLGFTALCLVAGIRLFQKKDLE